MIRMRGMDGCKTRMQELLARVGEDRRVPKPPVTAAPPSTQKAGSETASVSSGLRAAPSFARQLDLASALQPLDPLVGGRALQPIATGTSPETDLKALTREVAAKHGVDPAVFQALVQAESDFNQRLVSRAGAMGLAQLMPKTAASLGVSDPFDPRQNLDGGARYLSQMVKQFGGDLKLALAAYNAGPGAVQRAGGVPPFKETQDYVRKVLSQSENNKG